MSDKPIVALDYDGTVTLNVPMWIEIIKQFQQNGFEVIIVTWRTHNECIGNRAFGAIDSRIRELVHRIVPTERKAKQEFCAAYGIHPTLWIDDNPMAIFLGQEQTTAIIKE